MIERGQKFLALVDFYNSGIEPLENWETSHLVELVGLIDEELQNREFNTRMGFDAVIPVEDEFSDY